MDSWRTTEGQTRKIAEWTATHARKLGHEVDLRDSGINLTMPNLSGTKGLEWCDRQRPHSFAARIQIRY
jgi:hypothetical protein